MIGSLPSCSQAVRYASRFVGKSRKTGRLCGNCVLPRLAWRYDMAAGRNFQRAVGKRIGFDTGLEDRILLSSLSQRHRRLDEKKIRQLGQILSARIDEAASGNERLGSLGISFGRVKVNQSFTEVSVYWICNGVNDEEVSAALESERHALRRTMSETVGTNCPEIRFVPDRTSLMVEEMDRLFKSADYGMEYRAVSHTARVLSSAEPSRNPPKEKAPPKWWKPPTKS